jgi:hypothetical protein
MAKKRKVSGIGAIDRKIASERKKLADINKRKREEASKKKKLAALKKLQNKVRNAGGHHKRKRR